MTKVFLTQRREGAEAELLSADGSLIGLTADFLLHSRIKRALIFCNGMLSFCYMTLLIRDLPDDIAKQLEASARAARRSKEKQAMFLIETALRRRRKPAELREDAIKIHAQFKGKPAKMTDILKWTEAEK